MSKISRRRLAQTTVRLLREKPGRQADIVRSVAAYLIVHKQTAQAHLLINDIVRELKETEGHLFAEVRSAFALTGAVRAQLDTYLRRETGATTIELAEAVEPNLLSGVLVRTADQELDTTARQKLKQLASLSVWRNQ